MSLLVTKPGILTTIQDLGRTGRRGLGINPSGIMDRSAARIINTLLGNKDSEAVLELHFPAGELKFEHDCIFAIGGADFAPTLNDVEVRNWTAHRAAEGDLLRFPTRRSGMRAYLAVAGGFAIEEWLDSKSTNLVAKTGGFAGRALVAGDRLELADHKITTPNSLGPSMVPRYSRFPTVRVNAGAEFQLLTAVSEQDFLAAPFTLTNDVNRMGYRLTGPPLYLLESQEMISSAVTFGTIQLLPDGQLIVLMADHQTSGGYPRIGNIIEADLPLVAQLGPGDGLSFHIVTIEEAEQSILAFERDLAFLRTCVSFNL